MILPRFLPYVVKTVARATTRSVLTVVGAALALAVFSFVRTLERGVDALESGSGAPVLVVFQQSRFCPLTSALPTRYRADIESVPGVEAALPTLVYVNQCQSNLDLVTLHGVEEGLLPKVHGLRAVDGSLGAWQGDAQDGALVGERLAQRRGLHVGDRVRLGNVDVRVHAIVDAPGAGLDNVAFVPLRLLQRARKLEGKATEFLVKLAPGADAAAIARTLDERFATDEAPTDTKTMQAFVQGAVGEVSELVKFARLLGYLAVAVVVMVLGNTVFISAQTRAGELGTLETVGLPKTHLAALLTAESLLLALAGGTIGTGAVVAWFAWHPTTLGIEGFGIDFLAGLPVFVAGVVASLAIGLLAAIGPAVEALTRPLSSAVRPA